MASDLKITGAEQFGKVARALRQVGDKDLNRELYAGLNRSTKPLRADAKQSAAEVLPRRGGLAQRVAKARLSTRRRAGRDPGVRVVATGMDQLKRIDAGTVRHPVYGRGRWVVQKVTPGWFTKSMEAGAPDVRKDLVKLLDELARKIARRV